MVRKNVCVSQLVFAGEVEDQLHVVPIALKCNSSFQQVKQGNNSAKIQKVRAKKAALRKVDYNQSIDVTKISTAN